MVQHIKAADSVDTPTGTAFTFSSAVSETLLFDANVFLISQGGGDGAFLSGPLTTTINGEIGAFGPSSRGLLVTSSGVSNVTIGRSGDLFGDAAGILFQTAGKITNLGTITGDEDGIKSNATNVSIRNFGLIQAGSEGLSLSGAVVTINNSGTIHGTQAIATSGETHLTNTGLLDGNVLLGDVSDTFTNFQKVHKVVKNGTVSGVIDLRDGDDHFNGGNNNEKLRDGVGNDTYNFGGGNDYYIATTAGGVSADDTVNGGKGIDTYDASAAINSVSVSFNLGQAFGAFSQIGFDTISGFENAIGGSGEDFLSGNSAANTLIGDAGIDQLTGFGGRDILTGGTDADGFFFTKLSDSGTKAATRDVINDFSMAQGDYIDLVGLETSIGKNLFFIDRANFTHAAGEIRESFSGGDTIVSADINGDGKADFSILLKGHQLLDGFAFSL